MSEIEIWLAIAGLTLVTFLTRGAFLLLGNRVRIATRVLRALHYAPPAVLIALVVPSLLLDKQGQWAIHLHNYGLIAAFVAGIYFWFTRRMVGMIVLGMLVSILLRVYLPI
jgi:branched-subunit amino acid transport protein